MSLIKKPSEIKFTNLLKVLIYGQPGIGKSTLALSMPEALIIDCDKGLHRVQSSLISDVVQVEKWQDIDEVLNYDLSKYKSIIFDTGGKLIDYMQAYLIANNPKLNAGSGMLTLQGYGVRKAMFQTLLGRIDRLGKHVIFVAHEREEKDGDIRYVRPEIGGSSGNDLIKELDLVGYMEAIGTQRVIRFNPQEKFYAKNALELPDKMQIPDTSKGNIFMTNIIKTYEGRQADKLKKNEEYDALIELIKSNISDVKDSAGANDLIAWIKTVNHIWDSKFQASVLLSAQAKALGLVFDKSTGGYNEVKP